MGRPKGPKGGDRRVPQGPGGARLGNLIVHFTASVLAIIIRDTVGSAPPDSTQQPRSRTVRGEDVALVQREVEEGHLVKKGSKSRLVLSWGANGNLQAARRLTKVSPSDVFPRTGNGLAPQQKMLATPLTPPTEGTGPVFARSGIPQALCHVCRFRRGIRGLWDVRREPP